jgi:uncharacterized membrane protein YhaH (DUF805 family)
MGTFSLWHWLIILLIFSIPVAAVATESSNKTTSRRNLSFWILGIFVICNVTSFVTYLVTKDGKFSNLSVFIIFMIASFPLYQRYVRRARDAGMGKTIAYISILPVANLVCPIILLFKSSAEAIEAE